MKCRQRLLRSTTFGYEKTIDWKSQIEMSLFFRFMPLLEYRRLARRIVLYLTKDRRRVGEKWPKG